MTCIMLRNGVIHTGLATDGPVSAMAVEDGRIVWTGTDPTAFTRAGFAVPDEVVDLGGRLVTPAFVDSHVHVVETGEQILGLDLVGTPSRDAVLEKLAAYVTGLGPDALVIAQGWDETLWPDPTLPTAAELDRVSGGRKVYLNRIDGHSAVVSSALMIEVPGITGLAGWTPDGRVEREALRALLPLLADLTPAGDAQRGARAALRTMAGLGIGAFHDNAGPDIGPESDLTAVQSEAAAAGLHGTYYWGAHLGFGDLDRLDDLSGLAGDLSADGSIGSRSAAMTSDYADLAGHRGHAYLAPEQMAEHIIGCTRRGVQAGFHCIGDQAIDNIARAFRLAARALGPDAVRARRHRLEHCELPSPAAIETFADLGVVASVQPMFDGLWGGPDRMYAARLGERWQEMNPFRTLLDAGVRLAFGSDSPVTPLDPWAALHAAVHHRTPGQGITPAEAFAAHTADGWYAAGIDDAGTLAVGQRATYAVWDRTAFPDLTAPDVADVITSCLQTVVDGRTVFEKDRSEKEGVR
ncbi:amidohydrolase [Nocardioides sp. NPDC059952]|uniref:amidohydrolase n=1 Tax=Nocardioides sp. NPDC059952 TaxID=3347014 RepID=UPI0036623608